MDVFTALGKIKAAIPEKKVADEIQQDKPAERGGVQPSVPEFQFIQVYQNRLFLYT